MVSQAILGAIVGGGAAILGSFIQAWFNRQNTKDRIEAQNNREQAKFYVDQKVESLIELHEVLVECRDRISRELAGETPRASQEEYENEIWPLNKKLDIVLDKNRIFLDTRQEEKIFQANMKTLDAIEYLESFYDNSFEAPEVELSEYADITEEAMNVIKQEINEPIDNFETD